MKIDSILLSNLKNFSSKGIKARSNVFTHDKNNNDFFKPLTFDYAIKFKGSDFISNIDKSKTPAVVYNVLVNARQAENQSRILANRKSVEAKELYDEVSFEIEDIVNKAKNVNNYQKSLFDNVLLNSKEVYSEIMSLFENGDEILSDGTIRKVFVHSPFCKTLREYDSNGNLLREAAIEDNKLLVKEGFKTHSDGSKSIAKEYRFTNGMIKLDKLHTLQHLIQ